MIYKNTDYRAILAMEDARLGEYPEEDDMYECPICGTSAPETIYIDDDDACVGCDFCVRELNAQEYFERKI